MVGAVASDQLRFEHAELRGAVFRDVDLSGAKFIDAFMPGVSISGFVGGLTVNGVEVWPLIEAELDRLHPERVALRPNDGGSGSRSRSLPSSTRSSPFAPIERPGSRRTRRRSPTINSLHHDLKQVRRILRRPTRRCCNACAGCSTRSGGIIATPPAISPC